MSIFRKQFVVYLSILLISFVAMGLLLTQVTRSYFTWEKKEQLKKQGERIAEQYINAYSTGVIDISQLRYELQILENYMGAKVIFLDTRGNIVTVSRSIDQAWIGNTLVTALDVMDDIMEGKVVTVQGKLNGVFNEVMLTVCYPIMIDGTVVQIILMNTSLPELERNITEIHRIIILILLGATLLGFVLIYISSKTISMPLMVMNEAAKVIAMGNLDQRIDIQSPDEVGQLAQSFNYMAESLEKEELKKKNFIANMSHDFRSPLTSMQGFLTAMLDGTIQEERRDHYIGIVLDETKRLAKLANDIFELSKAEYFTDDVLEVTEFDMNALIRKQLAHFENRFKEKEIQVKLLLAAENSFVKADYDKIMRVLNNLLDNAVKFTPANGTVTVETTIQKEKLLVSVQDTGIGIDPENVQYIFDRFYKVDPSRGEDTKGGGLGLAIAKEFLKAQGETITCNSVVGEGTKFKFTLTLTDQKK